MKSEPSDILDENGIVTMAFDVVDFSGFEGKMGIINISRAFPVSISVDGITRTYMVPDMRSATFLKRKGSYLGSMTRSIFR
jgi:uncharacterized protein YabE (DUF348 family)